MSDAALDAMKAAGKALLSALESRSPSEIDGAVAVYRDAITHVRNCGAWHATPGLREAAQEMLEHVDLLTVRVRDLTRASSERLAALESVGAGLTHATYQRRAVGRG